MVIGQVENFLEETDILDLIPEWTNQRDSNHWVCGSDKTPSLDKYSQEYSNYSTYIFFVAYKSESKNWRFKSFNSDLVKTRGFQEWHAESASYQTQSRKGQK